MRRLTGSLFLSAVVLTAGGLAAACGSSHSGALASFSPSRTPTSLPSRTATPSPSLSPSAAPTHSASALPSHSASAPAAAGPTVTRTATATATATAQPSSASAAAGDTHSAVIWPWVLVGVLVVILIAVLISRAARRRSRAAGDWRSRVIDAYAKGSALHDAMSVAELPGALAAADAGDRWADIQRRADDLAQTLYQLRESAPGEEDRALVADSLTALQVVRSAMDAQRAPVGAGAQQASAQQASAQQAEVVRSRLSSFEASLRALRGPDGRPR
jgi:hypothetical protein